MVDDPSKDVRDHVGVAIEMLSKSLPKTHSLRQRLTVLLRDELEEHNPKAALYGLSAISNDLQKLKASPPGVVAGQNTLSQGAASVLLPGVDEAIAQLERALEILNRVPED